MIALALLVLAQAPVDAPASTKATEKLLELRAVFDKADCDKVIELSPYVEDHRLATAAERHEAMFRRGYCLVVIGNISDASSVFTEVFVEDADAAPPFEVEPRVRILIDAARSELMRSRAAARAAELEKQRARIIVDVDAPTALAGGNRAIFSVALTDPDKAVRSMRIDFRRKGEPEFYALPVLTLSDGTRRAEIPGTYTRSESGMTMEWYITASSSTGDVLKSVGTREQPNELHVLRGSIIAQDLRANERLSHATRGVIALVATPVLTSVGIAAGVFVSAVPAFVEGPDARPDDPTIVTNLLMSALPGLSAVGMTALVAYTVLDPVEAATVTGAALACAVLAEVGVVAMTFARDGRVLEVDRRPAAPDGLPGGVVWLGTIAGVILPTAAAVTLVALDPPVE